MAAEDLYRVLPLPGLDPESLGLPPMPPAPLPPQPSQGLAQSGNQKALTLASIAALLTGGPRMVGLGQGVMHGQQLLEQERMRRDQEQRQQFQQEEQAYRVQQQAYQQAAAARQKVLSDAVTGIRQQVQTKAIKSKADYDATVEQMAALLQNQFGMRVSPNYFRQAAAYVEPSSQERASAALDDVLKSPLTAEAMKADPSKVLLGKVQFDANGDGIPEQYALTELAALAGRPMIADEQGNPIIPEKADGKIGTPFQELLRSDLDQFRTENRRDPNPKEKSVIVQKAMEKSKEKPPTINVGGGAKSWIVRNGKVLRASEGEIQPGDLPYSAAQNPEKEPTQAAHTAAGYATRVEQANTILETLESGIAGMSLASFEVQKRAPATLQSGAMQSYDQAARNFINATLRRESGAVISPAEFDNARKQYLPQPGDTPQTLAQKRQNRMQIFASLKAASGKAYQEPVATPATDESDVQVGKFKVRVIQ